MFGWIIFLLEGFLELNQPISILQLLFPRDIQNDRPDFPGRLVGCVLRLDSRVDVQFFNGSGVLSGEVKRQLEIAFPNRQPEDGFLFVLDLVQPVFDVVVLHPGRVQPVLSIAQIDAEGGISGEGFL